MQLPSNTTTLDEAEHPLMETIARLTRVNGNRLAILSRPGADTTWVTAADVIAQGAQALPALLDRVARHLDTDDRRVSASFFLKAWCTFPVFLGVVAFSTEQRVPDITADNVVLRFGTSGLVDNAALASRGFSLLPTDPAAHHPDARVVADRAELFADLVDSLFTRHLALLVDALRPLVPLSTRYLWATIADTCAGYLAAISRHVGQLEPYYSDAAMLVGRMPLRPRTALVVSEDADPALVLRRGCCCFAYHLEQYGYCHTCPHAVAHGRSSGVTA